MPNMLRAPVLGPIVGHTTTQSVRIWIRGEGDDTHRTVGVAAIFDAADVLLQPPIYFRLHREYDRTGTVDFIGLQPNTRYIVRAGSLAIDSVDENVFVSDDDVFERLPEDTEVWEADLRKLPATHSEARFQTFAPAANALSFIL